MSSTPSSYQSAIYDWVDDGGDGTAAAVNAVAGSGKTTTLVAALKRMTGKVGFFAFNVAICKELANRVPRHVTVRTINSLGFATLRKAHRHIQVCQPTNAKIRGIVEKIMGDEMDDRTARAGAADLAGIAKLTLTDPRDANALTALIDRYDIDTGGNDSWVIDCMPEIFQESMNDQVYCDFNDQLWAPTALGLSPEKYDWIGLDECQDLSNAQRTLILRARKDRLLAVGDPRQAIYGFAAADCDSFDQVVNQSKATRFPLSICYRCPKSHVALAKKIVPQIEASTTAIDGEVLHLNPEKVVKRVQEGDLVICRCTAPLVELCLKLIRSGRKATVKGREIGKSLTSLVRMIRRHGGSINTFLVSLREYHQREARKLQEEDKLVKAANLTDRVETIYALADGVQTVPDLEAKIDGIFSDNVQGIMLSTVHRAKGLEADNVFLFRPDLMPHPAAKREWEREQEMNLLYVAYTRAKSVLGMVHDDEAVERRRRLQTYAGS